MAEETKQTILFGEAGIAVEQDDTERFPLRDGHVFVALKVEVRPSKKYGEYVVFDGENLDGDEFHAYSASGVITSQGKTMVEKYGGENGVLTAGILCTVVAKQSATTGRTFLTLA